MPLVVKICGLKDDASLHAALDAGADMVGFVFFEKSPRHISFDQARRLSARVEGRAMKVALTVDADDAALAAIATALTPDMLQLHGDETPARVAAVRARFGLPVMKAIGLATADDLACVAAYDAVADRLLFDAIPAAGADRPGGNGEAFEWTLLREIAPRRPWLLAGGLGPDNVAAALRDTGAMGVDVSSGVETSPGLKDAGLIADFVANARAARESRLDRHHRSANGGEPPTPAMSR